MSATDVARLVDRAGQIARREAPPAVLVAAAANRYAAHLLHVATDAGRRDAETACVLAAINLSNAVALWK